MTTTPPTIIIIRYGEISLKTPYVRRSFENRLITNIHHALTAAGLDHTITHEPGRIYLNTTHSTQALPILCRISGIVSYSPTTQTTSDLPGLTETALAYATPCLTPATSFALRVTRTGTHPYTSQDAARHLGAAIQTATHAPVDLTTPDHEIFIDIRGKHAYLFTEKFRGIGGLPVGTQGTVAILLHHPTDLLAAWYMMHRGCSILPITTQPTLIKAITQFQTTWNLTSTPQTLDGTHPDFYTHLTTLTTQHHCDAIATPTTLTDGPEALHHLTMLKTMLHLPILTPLIALTPNEVITQCTQYHIPCA